MTDFTNYGTGKSFNDPSTSFGNMKKGLTLRFWSLTYMKDASEEIVFKAFITDFSDEFASSWSEEVVYGRQDPLAVFQNTARTITVALDIPASDMKEGRNNLFKMQKLIQGVYPVYESFDKVPVLQAAPLWKIKLSNFITAVVSPNASAKTGGLTCKINGITFTPDLEPGMFVDNGTFYPKNIKLNFTCTVFHNHTVGFNANKQFQTKNGLNFPYGADSVETTAAAEDALIRTGQDAQGWLPETVREAAGATETASATDMRASEAKGSLFTPAAQIQSKIKETKIKNMTEGMREHKS